MSLLKITTIKKKKKKISNQRSQKLKHNLKK